MIVALSWNQVVNATSYRVYRSDTSGDMSPLRIASTTGTNWTDVPPEPQIWFYVVTSVDNDGESLFSPELEADPNATLSFPSGLAVVITT